MNIFYYDVYPESPKPSPENGTSCAFDIPATKFYQPQHEYTNGAHSTHLHERVTLHFNEGVDMPINYEEKRDFIRMDTDSQISYREDGSHETHLGHCINLSASGVLFTSNYRIEPGTVIHINITPSLQVVPPLDATVEVVRAQSHKSDRYAIAGAIRSINNTLSQAS